jgi:hypothetical protein
LHLAIGAAGVAALGLLHAVAAGAVVLAGLALAVPEVIDVDGGVEAAAHAVALGLACLRVPLEAGDVQGTFAPLSGLLVTLWGLAGSVRKAAPGWGARRGQQVAAVAIGFAATCAGAAAGAGAFADLEASVSGAALAGLVWGGVAAAWATRGRGADAGDHRSPFVVGTPSVAPGFTGLAVALGLAAVWFVVVLVVALVGSSPRAFAGGLVLGLAALPNAAAALAGLALGAPVEAVLDGTALPGPVAESLSLWDWGGGLAPAHVLALVVVPLVAGSIAGRRAAAVTPGDPSLTRGLRSGAVLGAGLVVAGLAGSLAATAGAAGERVDVRLGSAPLVVFGLALVWGVVGAYAGPRLGGSRVPS